MSLRYVSLLISVALLPSPCSGQAIPYKLPEKALDENGVNLPTGQLMLKFPLVRFGDQVRLRSIFDGSYPDGGGAWITALDTAVSVGSLAAPELLVDDVKYSNPWRTPLGDAVWANPSNSQVVMPDGHVFKPPVAGRFLTPVFDAPYRYPDNRTFLGVYSESGDRYQPIVSDTATSAASLVTFADGEQWTIIYQKDAIGGARQRYITSNRGYIIQYEYLREAAPIIQSQKYDWRTPAKISGASLVSEYCDTSLLAVCANVSNSGNSVIFQVFDGQAAGFEIDWADGTQKKFIRNGGSYVISDATGNSSLTVAAGGTTCGGGSILSSLSKAGQTWTYDYSIDQDTQCAWALNRTDPVGKTRYLTWDWETSIIDQYRDERGAIWSQLGSAVEGYTGVRFPEANELHYELDSRNNRTGLIAKDKNGATSRVWNATYDTVCANLITCNRPNTVTDARGNTTTYTYDSVHGGVLTKTGPAVSGVTPQTRYEYAQRYAWLKNVSGGYSQAASPIWMLVRERFCRTTNPSGSNCAGGAADEVVTDYDYGPNSGPNNLLIRGVAVTADGQTRRTCYGYDQMGRKISETKPAAGLAVCP